MTTVIILFLAVAIATVAAMVAIMGWPGFGYYCVGCYAVLGVTLSALWAARLVDRWRRRPRLPRATARRRGVA